jgi:hypothetical protein
MTIYEFWMSTDGTETSLQAADHPQRDFLRKDTDGRDMTMVVRFEAQSWGHAKAIAERIIGGACIDCLDEDGSSPERRCRDCNLDWLVEQSCCELCGWWRVNELGERTMFGPHMHNHMTACPYMAV